MTSLADEILSVARRLRGRDIDKRTAAHVLEVIALKVQVLERGRPCRDGWHKIPPYGYVPDEAQAPYVAGPVAEEPE